MFRGALFWIQGPCRIFDNFKSLLLLGVGLMEVNYEQKMQGMGHRSSITWLSRERNFNLRRKDHCEIPRRLDRGTKHFL